MTGHSEDVYAVAWSPDGGRLASGSGDSTVWVWNAETGAAMMTIEGHSSYVYAVTWSPDGGRLASGSDDTTVRVWHIGTEAGSGMAAAPTTPPPPTTAVLVAPAGPAVGPGAAPLADLGAAPAVTLEEALAAARVRRRRALP